MIWKDKYEIGVALIDNQHRELFRCVDTFLQVLRSSVSSEEQAKNAKETLVFMNWYVVKHFRDEEIYQSGIGYSDSEAHKKSHEDMVRYIAQLSCEYAESGYDEPLMQRFAGKILAQLIHHVAAEAQLFTAFAIEKGVACYDR